jgi:hypothetical protein
MKLMKKTLVGVAVAAALVAPSFASTVAIADMNIFGLGLVSLTGAPFSPANGTLTVLTESRTGTADASYNGSPAVGIGAGSITTPGVGAVVDVQNRCAGDCGAGTAALYGGVLENNVMTHLATPGTSNFALGDMYISGSVIGGGITGLTRANAMTAGATNQGGSNATIKNAAQISGTFTSSGTYTGMIAVVADWYLQTYVNTVAPTTGLADAGFGWNMKVTSFDDTSFVTLNFAPDELNQSFFSTQLAENQLYSDDGSVAGIGEAYLSAVRTYNAGKHYNFSINQSSNVAVSEIPEPESLALVGLGLLGLAAARRRKAA